MTRIAIARQDSDELGEVRSMSSAQFTCQLHKEGYLEDRNDFYRKQLSY
jgi:hypothetical protein